MMNIKDNKVKIEGILSESDIKPVSFKRGGVDTEAISGVIKVRVQQPINGIEKTLEIPVHMFATKFTKAGTPNPAFESINRIATEFVSIAAGGIEHADCVRITGANLNMNEYYGQNGNLISFPRVSASFVQKIAKTECKPEATFNLTFMVGSKKAETDKDGVETGRYIINGFLPQYGNKIDIVPFYAINPGVIDAISNYWNEGDTVKATGRLNFSSTVETRKVEVDFGEPTEETRTISISEAIISGGSQTPLEGDFALNIDEVKAALAERSARLEELKNKDTAKAAPAKKGAFSEFGF